MNAVPRDKSLQMQLRLKAEDTDGRIRIMLGSPWTTKGGVEIGLVDVKAGSTCREFYAPLSIPAKLHKGKQPLFFVFESETEASPSVSFMISSCWHAISLYTYGGGYLSCETF